MNTKNWGTPITRKERSSLCQGVVSVSKTTTETDTPTMETKSSTDRTPLSLTASTWGNDHGPSWSGAWNRYNTKAGRPGVTQFNKAGKTMTPVASGTKSHTLLKKSQNSIRELI